MKNPFEVSRYTHPSCSDGLKVGPFDFKLHRDIVEQEWKNQKAKSGTRLGGSNMRPIFYTNSPYGESILILAAMCRPHMADEILAYIATSVKA